MDDPDQGLGALDSADVLIYWCHRRVKEQDDRRNEAIVQRVLEGKLSLIALHSAHWAKPFVRLKQERGQSRRVETTARVGALDSQVGIPQRTTLLQSCQSRREADTVR